MKHILKKNQIIITALAIMIAVAGYLNYSGTTLTKDDTAKALANKKETAATEETSIDDSALIDVPSLDADVEDVVAAETDAADVADVADLETAEGEISDTPGEAVLTSIPSNSGFAAEAKLNREQIRAKNKEALLEVINNDTIDQTQKQNAIDSVTGITEISEREAAAELMLEAKGFTDSVVSITDDKADVVIGLTEIADAQRAQIEDIVKRKTDVPGENIVITPMAPLATEEKK